MGRLRGQGDPSHALDLTARRDANSCPGAGCVKRKAPVFRGLFCSGASDLKASGLESLRTEPPFRPLSLPACGSRPVALIFDVLNSANARKTGE